MKTTDTSETKIEVFDENGTPMRFTESLLAYLANRDRSGKFHLSDWLQALDGEMLYHFREVARMASDNPESIGNAMSDIIGVVVHVIGAERQTLDVTFSIDELGQYIAMLHHMATLERLRRNGLLDFNDPLSIEPGADTEVTLPHFG